MLVDDSLYGFDDFPAEEVVFAGGGSSIMSLRWRVTSLGMSLG